MKRLVKTQIEFNGGLIGTFTAGFDGEDFLARLPGQGESINWVLGHVAVNEDYFLSVLSGAAPSLSSELHELYRADNSPPIPTKEALPRDKVVALFETTRSRVLRDLEAADMARFGERAPVSELPSAFATRADIWGLIATHPYWHVGHLATLAHTLRPAM